jgi:hypothetical protein
LLLLVVPLLLSLLVLVVRVLLLQEQPDQTAQVRCLEVFQQLVVEAALVVPQMPLQVVLVVVGVTEETRAEQEQTVKGMLEPMILLAAMVQAVAAARVLWG